MRTHAYGLTWVHTGDLGVMDEDGFVYFRQRIKRMIVTSGYNVYPSQMENIFDAHEAVHMSCVIGVPDPYKIQKIKAFVVLKPGFEAGEAMKKQLLEYCSKHVAKYAMPYDIEFRQDLPKTLVGKVAYKVLEAAIAKGNELKERFVDVMNRDSEVFDVLIESLALPKENDAQKAIRRGAVQASFRNCTEVPLTMMEVCLESIDLLATLVGTTNPNVVSDLGIAALTLKTAMQSAWLNVLINLSSLKDKEYADECCHKGEAMLAHAIPLAEESYEKVLKVIEKK